MTTAATLVRQEFAAVLESCSRIDGRLTDADTPSWENEGPSDGSALPPDQRSHGGTRRPPQIRVAGFGETFRRIASLCSWTPCYFRT